VTCGVQVALVGQEPVLFSRSLKDNIVYGLEDFSDMKLLHHAAVLSNAHDFIAEMSSQYDTEAGEKGLQLSGIILVLEYSYSIFTDLQLSFLAKRSACHLCASESSE